MVVGKFVMWGIGLALVGLFIHRSLGVGIGNASAEIGSGFGNIGSGIGSIGGGIGAFGTGIGTAIGGIFSPIKNLFDFFGGGGVDNKTLTTTTTANTTSGGSTGRPNPREVTNASSTSHRPRESQTLKDDALSVAIRESHAQFPSRFPKQYTEYLRSQGIIA